MQETKEWERAQWEKKGKRVMSGKGKGGKGNKSLATEIMIKCLNEKGTKSTTKNIYHERNGKLNGNIDCAFSSTAGKHSFCH